ncbi:hypothetical protein GCM10023093_17660 [Nemorincola caseinilytica]|uniref:DUF2281 domain-containing protein n=1 Tax=Nemorincola caseinilytica TaxID=2054315 RepID=A0ABP8NHD4_9BACT
MPDNKTNTPSQELIDALATFLTQNDPSKISRDLRRIFLDYLIHQIDLLPSGFSGTVAGLYDLFELLDTATEETKNWQRD